MRIIRPRALVGAATVTWVATMGALMYATSVWASYERLEQRWRVPTGIAVPKPATLPTSKHLPVKPGIFSAGHVTMRSDSSAYPATKASTDGSVGNVVRLKNYAHAAAHLCGIDRDLAWSIALRESSGRHWGADGRVLRSSSGAYGLFQIKVATARDVAEDLDIMQPWGNALAGVCYFRQMLDKARGNVRLALTYYSRGPNAKGPTPQASHDYANDIIQGAN